MALSLALSPIIVSYLKLKTTSRLNFSEKIWSERNTGVARDTQHMMNTFMSKSLIIFDAPLTSRVLQVSHGARRDAFLARRVYFYRSVIFSTLTKKTLIPAHKQATQHERPYPYPLRELLYYTADFQLQLQQFHQF